MYNKWVLLDRVHGFVLEKVKVLTKKYSKNLLNAPF